MHWEESGARMSYVIHFPWFDSHEYIKLHGDGNFAIHKQKAFFTWKGETKKKVQHKIKLLLIRALLSLLLNDL